MPIIHLDNNQTRLSIQPEFGGRITALACDNYNALTVDGPQTGSTYWPSPQSSWGWPPLAALDSEVYSVIAQSPEKIVIESAVCPQSKLQLRKTFRTEGKGFAITYTLFNRHDQSQQFAPWEISRAYGGLTFFESPTPLLNQSTLQADTELGAYWYHYSPQGLDNNIKLFANNSTGWIANIQGNMLHLKQFPQIPEQEIAPEEAEIEIYAHGDPENAYIEIEQQGALTNLESDESAKWTVQWRLLPLPDGLSETSDRKRLLDVVKSLINE